MCAKCDSSSNTINVIDSQNLQSSIASNPQLIPDRNKNRPTLLSQCATIPGAGVFLATLSGMIFATGSLVVKLVPEIHPIEIVCFRSLMQAIVYSIIICLRGTPWTGVKGERFALISRCFNGFMSLSCGYSAMRLIPLGDASSIVFSSPIFVTLIACLFMKEPCGIVQILTLIMGISGIVLICKPSFLFGHSSDWLDEENRIFGTFLAFFGCICAGLVFISIRKLPKTAPAVSIFFFSIFSLVLGGTILYWLDEFRTPSSTRVWLLLILNGICGTLGQFLLTVSLKIENAGPVSLARTIDIVMAFIYQVFILNQVIQITSLIGAIVICFGVILLALQKWYQQKPELFKSLIPFRHGPTASSAQNCPSPLHLSSGLPDKKDANNNTTSSDIAV